MSLLLRVLGSALLVAGALVAGLAYCPAQVMRMWLPPRIEVATLSGTVLNGTATGIRVTHVPVGDLEWHVDLSSLLCAHPVGTVAMTHEKDYVHLRFDIAHSDTLRLTDIDAVVSLALLNTILRQPTAADTRAVASWLGVLHANLNSLTIRHGWPTAINGHVTLSQLQFPKSDVILGSYEMSFTELSRADGTVVGQIHDVDGLLKVAAVLDLAPSRSFKLTGDIASSPNAPDEVRNALAFLGIYALTGPHDFEITGTY